MDEHLRIGLLRDQLPERCLEMCVVLTGSLLKNRLPLASIEMVENFFCSCGTCLSQSPAD